MSLSLNPGVLSGRYRLDSLIAVGGMGEVWRGVDLVLDRPVAVKVVQPEYTQHPETLERFRAEARHAAGLSHPAIAQVYDFGESCDGQPPFLVMELVDGPPLTSLLAAGPLDPGPTLDVVAQVASGLAVAHAAGVVHRDIKPGNLLVDEHGGIKITDFGIAHSEGSAPLTRTGMVMGTPAYLAPERVGGAAADAASDLYSLGMVAYHCLSGRLPFTGTPLEIAVAQRDQALPPLPDSVPPQVACLVASLTAREPDLRPASAAQVAARSAALRAELKGENASAVGLAASAARAAQGGPDGQQPEPAYSAVGDDGPTRLLASPPAAAPRSRNRALLAVVAALILALCLGGWVLASSAASGRPGHSAGHSPASHTSGRTVLVRASALIGQPAHQVARELRSHGLIVRIARARAPGRRPDTVIGVTPSGWLRPGTSVQLTAARRPSHWPPHGRHGDHGHGHTHRHGHPDGNDNGQDATAQPLRQQLTQAALPQAALPQAALPQAALPQAALPRTALPRAALPQAPLVQVTLPVRGYSPGRAGHRLIRGMLLWRRQFGP
jgi:eukaryotic-like serine/threonine-protein kinase